ncbi:type IV pilus secretin PilQ family protein [Photobacterium gaetbulicola]|uniref:Putative fimbrial assembly protein n=1 Tax=Photobacterium gaetbulicola Gung47 TaxID=658445 RepID=A0A0C5WJG1_9GAMM|nr:type IV pilus secretin PilQ family protein [Photobacterium gaetbulicola]AJR07273.1 putative fimbrial assembly protein [Photobacterium gaetbulicola Gung47]PSU13688.1 type IV pilus secretin PilQ family protein [Photobacterium gaetbulicola]
MTRNWLQALRLRWAKGVARGGWRVLLGVALLHGHAVAATAVTQISNIDFSRNVKGGGVLEVVLSSGAIEVGARRLDKQLVIELPQVELPEELVYVLDVKEFGTPVLAVETFQMASGSRLVLAVEGDYRYDYTTRDTAGSASLLVTVQPTVQPQGGRGGKAGIRYDSKPISINFQDVPVRNVLQLIAEYNDFNLVVSDSVQGNLTLRLDEVPWQQVLDIILRAKGLDKREQGSVLMVAPKEELARSEQQVLESKRKAEELASLRSEIFKINYANALELGGLLQGADDGISMLSARGSLHIDERTNSLIINDIPDSLANIRDIVAALDIPVQQVEIEARIVTINEGDIDELGVRWGILKTNGSSTLGGSIEGNLASAGLLDITDGEKAVENFLNVNLGATSPGASSIAFQVAKMGDILLDLELSALQSEQKAEVISSPRLVTTNKKMAYIEQGTEIPYLEAASSGAVSVSFKKAVLSLMVTPQITSDGNLVLDLVVTQDKKGKVVQTGTGEAVAIDTQRIGTQVLVANGETVVLGGIYQHAITNAVRKVPLLGDLPVLGALFRHRLEELGKKELLIFVTPKIVYQ